MKPGRLNKPGPETQQRPTWLLPRPEHHTRPPDPFPGRVLRPVPLGSFPRPRVTPVAAHTAFGHREARQSHQRPASGRWAGPAR